MMFRSTRPEKDDSGSDWDNDSSEATPAPVTNAPSTPDRSQLAAPVQHVKKPSSAHSDTSSTVQPPRKASAEIQFTNIERQPRKASAEIQFTNIERQQTPGDRDTPFAAARPDYRIAKDEFTQTEQRHIEEPVNEAVPVDTNLELLGTRMALPRSSSGFSFIATCEDNTRLVLDHHSVESVMGGIATRSEQKYRRCAAEVFSTLRIVSDCLIVFLLECVFFAAHHVCYKLLCGAGAVLADALCKPGIPACFNSALWPLYMLAFKMNRATMLCLGPCVDLLGAVAGHCAMVAKACRLVQVDTHNKTEQV